MLMLFIMKTGSLCLFQYYTPKQVGTTVGSKDRFKADICTLSLDAQVKEQEKKG